MSSLQVVKPCRQLSAYTSEGTTKCSRQLAQIDEGNQKGFVCICGAKSTWHAAYGKADLNPSRVQNTPKRLHLLPNPFNG